MPPFELEPEEEDYVSEEDSDFAPEEAQPEVDELSASDNDEAPAASASKQLKHPADDLGSGDEAIIDKAKKRRKKIQAKDGGAVGEDNDEGGKGGLVKTRSMRAVEKQKRHATTSKGPVTVDVDALWAQMNSEPTATAPPRPAETQPEPMDTSAEQPQQQEPSLATQKQPDTILIKRTYNFAGKVHTEEKLVARDSAEAKLYLASLGKEDAAELEAAPESSPKKMPRKAFRSTFEPIPTDGALQQRTDLNLGVAGRLRARDEATANAKKLNTVEKSRMDWAGYVDKEGIKDELTLAGKSKQSFAARQDFLARSEAKREEDARRARLAGRVP